MPQLLRRARGARPRRGVTLIEVMITITLLAIVGGLLTRVLTRQQRFYRDATESVTVKRELRSGATFLPTDVRAVSTVGGDLLAASATSFTVRSPIGSAVVCAINAARDRIDLVPLATDAHTLTSWYATPAHRDTVFVFDDGTSTGAEDDSWAKGAVQVYSTSTSVCAGSPYLHTAADAGRARPQITLYAPLPGTVTVGAVVRITRPMRYTVYQPSGSTDWYLGFQEHSGATWPAVQPVAGPLRANDGARFAYFDTLSVERVNPTGAALNEISRIDVMLRASGRTASVTERLGTPVQDSLNFRIGVRNFR